jgi:tetratricopeptide (TPR) repeat protein
MRTHCHSTEHRPRNRADLVWLYAGPGGDFGMALALALADVERAPNQAHAHHTLGWVYYRNGLPSLAIAAFRRSVEKEPTNPIYFRHLALAYAKTGDWASSKHCLEQAARLGPGSGPRFSLDCVDFQV